MEDKSAIPQGWSKIGSGLDSTVYITQDNKIGKIYNLSMGWFLAISEYCYDTQHASDMFKGIKMDLDGRVFNFRILPQGNPDIISGRPALVGQEYILGDNLRQMERNGHDISLYTSLISMAGSMINLTMNRQFNIASCNVKPIIREKETDLIITDLVSCIRWTYR